MTLIEQLHYFPYFHTQVRFLCTLILLEYPILAFDTVNNHDYFHDPYSLTNILLKHVHQVVLEYQEVHAVIGL